MPVEPKLADDLLTGADEIAHYLGWPRWRIYHAVRCGTLPIGRHGGLLISRKSKLDRALSGDAASAQEVA
jgi:hypothetical protein